ncbi:hypothetical protein KL911_002753 [Ogataea haglerorum]|uniref:uncharacterized protein n=1 Tax=Ogataea haglerorum TaxID=1937702 RepID=UPI001C8AB325|nr:uncharacterized protein KL911_002753 [Ogataea haglerorum]KAG7753360.1 hypothetical protein KL911_002753 [Ogataea haglerorum]
MTGLNQYSLMKIEKLEILNRLPRTIVSLFSVIEECDQRFSDEQCNNMLELVQRCFPVAQEAVEDDAMDMEQEEDEEEEEEMVAEQFEMVELEHETFEKIDEAEEQEE